MNSGPDLHRIRHILLHPILLAAAFAVAGCEEINSSKSNDAPQAEEAPRNDSNGWRNGRDVAVLSATDNAVEWETRNIQAPTTVNQPGDCEWIIARVNGSGFSRLLIMTMHTSGGVRDPARISLDGPGGGIADGRFSVPLPGPSRWRIAYRDGALRLWLNGREIWSVRGNFSVDRVTIGDSPPRGFLGEWREVR